MKKNIFVVLLLICCSFNGVLADQVSCERIESYAWGLGNFKTCYMEGRTQINSADTNIASRDESVQGLAFWSNKKIKFLPVVLSDKFPNLLGLDANSCSLTTISKANFKGLNKLRYLSLYNNQIEKIASDVFDDLVALENLYLSGNKLKFINGKAFARLTKLKIVYLHSNQCISEDLYEPSRIAVLQQTVNAKCSYEEELEETPVETSTFTATTTVSNLVCKKCDVNQDLATFANITLEGIETKASEVISKLNELKIQQKEECGNIVAKALEAQAKTNAKSSKDLQTYFNEALANKTAKIVEVNKKLAQTMALAEMQANLKMSEIEKLNQELQRKNQEIIENRQKIQKLEEKTVILT